MLDIKLLREEPDKVKEGIQKKGVNPALVDEFLALDATWRTLTKEIDDLRAEQKKLGEAKKIEEAKALKETLKMKEGELKELETSRDAILQKFPNLPFDDVPVGKDESENKVIRKWGEPTSFDFEAKDHVALGESLGLIEIEKAGKIAGTRFAYLKGDAVLLQMALIAHTFKTLGDEAVLAPIAEKAGVPSKPFIPVLPPVMIKPDVYQRMGRLEPKEERYYIPSDDIYLIGSAEHTLGPLHMDETLGEDALPIRYIGYSTSFRREAGSYGKDTRGILRVHQFDKLEMETFTAPEDSTKEQDFIVGIQEYLMQSLAIPYQVVAICTGDMGGPDARQIDIEAWMPGQDRYRETHTSDLITDYQSRRLGIRVRRKDGATALAHMNDATAFAIGRTLIAIMENYQTADGKIRVPEVLQKYLGKDIIE